MMRNIIIIGIGLALLIGLTIHHIIPEHRSETILVNKEISEIKTRIFGRLSKVLDQPGMAYNRHSILERFESDDHPNAFFFAQKGNVNDPLGYQLIYDDPKCGFIHPAGRLFSPFTIGDKIINITLLTPLSTLTASDILSLAQKTINNIESKGWKLDRPSHREITVDMLNNANEDNDYFKLGRWQSCSDPYVALTLSISMVNQQTATAMTPPVILGIPSEKNTQPTFLLKTYITGTRSPTYEKAYALYKARRMAVHGDPNKPIPYKIWYDNPHWLPESGNGNYNRN